MSRLLTSSTAAAALSAALALVACKQEIRDAHKGALINLTGCLQKGDDAGDYLLTVVNKPSESVGTAGVSNADQVVREETRAAKNTYRVDGKGFDLESLVGKQLRVSGTLEQGSDVWQKARDAKRDSADNGQPQVPEIKEGDLAKVNATNIEKINEVCR